MIPRVDVKSWKLEIDGDVERPYSISFDELLAMPMIERHITLNCVSNEVGGPYISSTLWQGVRVKDLLERAGVKDNVDQILSESTDGMTISTPIEALTDDRDAIIAVAMNGEPLPARHGFPARMVTPGLYGFVGATKWVTKLTATTYAKDKAYWTERDWLDRRHRQDPGPHRHPSGSGDLRARQARHRRRRLGAGPRYRGGRGPGRRRPLGEGHPRTGRGHRLLATVVLGVGRQERTARPVGACHRRHR